MRRLRSGGMLDRCCFGVDHHSFPKKSNRTNSTMRLTNPDSASFHGYVNPPAPISAGGGRHFPPPLFGERGSESTYFMRLSNKRKHSFRPLFFHGKLIE